MRRVLLIAALLLAGCGRERTCEDEGLRQHLDHYDQCIDADGRLYAAPRHRKANR